MGRVLLPYLDTIRVKGRAYFYYRRGSLRQRIRGEPGTPEFDAAYQAVHQPAEAAERNRRTPAADGSLAALIAAYRASPDWGELRETTHKDYQKALRPLEEKYGAVQVATIPRAFVMALRDKYAVTIRTKPDGSVEKIATPRKANRMVAVLSILMTWAVDRGWRTDNPCLRPKKLRTGPGWRAWTDEELAQVLTAETTSAEIRLAIQLAVHTGQRGEDLIAMTWSAFDGQAIQVRQEKTCAQVWIPCLPELRKILAAEPRRALTILSRPAKRAKKGAPSFVPWKIDHYRHAMGAAIKAAGVTGVVSHGLRPTAVRNLAEAGCADAEIQAITGHRTTNMAAHYRRHASQKRLATAAIARLGKHKPAADGDA